MIINAVVVDVCRMCYTVSFWGTLPIFFGVQKAAVLPWRVGPNLFVCEPDPWQYFSRIRRVAPTAQERATCLYSAYYELLISRRSGMARVNERSRSFTATHTFIHKWNEPYPLTPSRRASPHFGWYSFPVLLRVGG